MEEAPKIATMRAMAGPQIQSARASGAGRWSVWAWADERGASITRGMDTGPLERKRIHEPTRDERHPHEAGEQQETEAQLLPRLVLHQVANTTDTKPENKSSNRKWLSIQSPGT